MGNKRKRRKKKSIEDELDQILIDIDNIHLCETILNDIKDEDNQEIGY